ncbi:hypothetical protein D3C86_1834390 [compost metagenome]
MSEFGVARGQHFQHQIGTEGGGSAADGRADCGEGTVGNAGADASSALHRDLVALADQLLDGFGRGGYPRFAGMGFERNTNVHVKSPA